MIFINKKETMNAYFFNMTNEERTNILDQHKKLYDGYVTEYGTSNQYPLYVQDLANDKKGITVSNTGKVTEYKNMNINEMKHDNKDTGLFSDEVNEYHVGVPPLDGIGDGPLDLKHGTVGDFEDEDEDDEFMDDHLKFYDDSMGDFYQDLDKDDFDDDFDDSDILSIEENVNKTLDMFRRIS